MNYTGIIIEESLEDTAILQQVVIKETKIEQVTSHHKTPWLTQWRLHTVEIPEDVINQIVHGISYSFDKKHPEWYADFKNNCFHYIVYDQKVFKVDIKHPVLYSDAKEYGRSLGIPDYQLDFAPNDKMWERKTE